MSIDFPYLVIESLEGSERSKNRSLLCRSQFASFSSGDYFLFPQGKSLKVKRIHKKEKSWSLEVKGIPLAAIKKDHILIPADSGIIPERDFACHAGGYNEVDGFRFSLSMENSPAIFRNMTAELSGKGRVKRLCFKRAIPFKPAIHFESDKGQTAILLFPWPQSAPHRADMFSYWKEKKHPNPGLIYKYLLTRDGVVRVPAGYRLSVDPHKIETPFASWYMQKRTLVQLRNQILKRCEKPGGVLVRELKEYIKGSEELIDLLVGALRREKLLQKKEGFLISLRKEGQEKLSPFDKNMLQKCIDAGEAGLALGAVRQAAQIEAYQGMARMGLCHINNEIILADEFYRKISRQIQDIKETRSDCDLSVLKRELPVSRKILVAVLDWMDCE